MIRNTRSDVSSNRGRLFAHQPSTSGRIDKEPAKHSRNHRTWPATAAVAGLTGLLAIAAAAPASASPGQATVDHWTNDSTLVHPQGSEDFCDLPFDVVEHNHEDGNGTRVFHGPDGNYYTWARFTGTTTWTNPNNGHEFRQEYAGSDRDQDVVDNGDGTVTITVQDTGPSRYSANGTFVFLDSGMSRYRIIIDRKGTPTNLDDDEFVAFLGVDKSVGVRQTEGRDFCADLSDYLG